MENVTKIYGNKAGGSWGNPSNEVVFDLELERCTGILQATLAEVTSWEDKTLCARAQKHEEGQGLFGWRNRAGKMMSDSGGAVSGTDLVRFPRWDHRSRCLVLLLHQQPASHSLREGTSVSMLVSLPYMGTKPHHRSWLRYP